MLRRGFVIISLTVMLCWPGLAFGFCPGPGICEPSPIPVIDVEANPINWVKQLAHMITQIRDMIRQAKLGHVDQSLRTSIFLAEQATRQYGEALTYSNGGTEVFPEVFTFDEVNLDNTYLEQDLDTDRRTLDTYRTALAWAEQRQLEFEEDEGIIEALEDSVNGADGRNAIMASQSAVFLHMIQEQRKTQQLLMAQINLQTVGEARKLNEKVRQQANERAYMQNYDRKIPEPTWADVGL